VQRIFRTLPGKKESFKEAVEALEGYFAPRRNVVAERHKFRSRKQNADETVDAYLTSLRELVKTCEFGALEDDGNAKGSNRRKMPFKTTKRKTLSSRRTRPV
jgi:hypothetical protein